MTESQKLTIESYDNTAEGFSKKIAMLDNYDEAYEFFAGCLKEGGDLLDLACGPAQISKFVLARKKMSVTGVDLSKGMLAVAQREIPSGKFIEASIIDFKDSSGKKFDGCALGFGLPYLSTTEARQCILNAASNLREGGIFYVSFMETKNGEKEFVQMEKTSFGGDRDFEIHYHSVAVVKEYMMEAGFEVLKDFCLDYLESDGSISKDLVYICRLKIA